MYMSGKRRYFPDKLKNLPVNDRDRHLFQTLAVLYVTLPVLQWIVALD